MLTEPPKIISETKVHTLRNSEVQSYKRGEGSTDKTKDKVSET
jgi:hypothetical protein